MQVDELLRVLQEEFALAAPEVDAALMQWLGHAGEGDARHAAQAAELYGRLAQACRLVSLEGLAIVLELLRDSAQVYAGMDGAELQEGLAWLVSWQPPVAAYLDAPGDERAVRQVVDFLRVAPASPTLEQLDELALLLCRPPAVPVEHPSAESRGSDTAALDLQDEDVSLEVPPDVDPPLFEVFLDDAPSQLEVLAQAVRQLAQGDVSLAALQEARRVAHTFKGSGHIIGIRGVARLAHRLEDVLDHVVERRGCIPRPLADDLEQAVACLDRMVYALRGEESPPDDALEWLERLGRWARAAHEGRLDAWGADTLPAALDEPPETGPPLRAAPQPSPARGPAPAVGTSLRIGVATLDALVRRAGQGLVHHGRLEEQLRTIEDRLMQLEAGNRQLQNRLRDLEIGLGGHSVALQAGADEDRAFDALELDRYNELQTVLRFACETAADEAAHASAARQEAQAALQTVRQQGLELVEQHRELIGARLVPVRQIVARLRRNVAQTAAATGKQVRLEVQGEQAMVDADVLGRLTEPLLHLLRNAVDHGIEPPQERQRAGKPAEGIVMLRVERDSQRVVVRCEDDGRGLDLAAIHARAVELGLLQREAAVTPSELARLILLPGFSTRSQVTEVSGRGVGMDVVADRLRAMKGRIEIDTEPGRGTRIALHVPATTGVQHALLVQVEDQTYALPSDGVVLALAAGQGQVGMGSVGPVFRYAGREWRYQKLGGWLGLGGTDAGGAAKPVVLARAASGEVALEVDRIVDSRDLILQDIGRLLRRVRGVAGAALRPDGRVLFLLDLEALEQAAATPVRRQAGRVLRRRLQAPRKHALVVDDAISVRQTLAQLLQDAGFDVTTARDGFDALDALLRYKVDVVITDLEMPNLNGLELTRRLRESRLWKGVPVMMLTSRATAKHQRSAEAAGVDVFLTKPYDDARLLAELRRLTAPGAKT
ncbi:hybrid sensor histidine kinase/response regulator [Caldimonas aquatica]|uniref:histidine kinase n=1 Tax=Caldimonas aquatica TaxID=376175 RepID=A0ABY6MS11_9BURK|nr:response regulator [Schlegelella aquatica]UZD54803.1 response regulator [Schlegelella aquatica]